MEHWDFQALEAFDRTALEELGKFLGEVDNQAYARAAELIVAAQKRGNRVHITGIGKPGHVSEYGASLLSSTGTPPISSTGQRRFTVPAGSWCRGMWSSPFPTAEKPRS